MKILAVESDPKMRMALSVLGRQATLRFCFSGMEALKALPEFQPDAVLIDVEMPRADAHAVARFIRSKYQAASITIVFLTQHCEEPSKKYHKASGADFLICKPLTQDKLGLLWKRLSEGERRDGESPDSTAQGRGPTARGLNRRPSRHKTFDVTRRSRQAKATRAYREWQAPSRVRPHTNATRKRALGGLERYPPEGVGNKGL